MIFSELKNMADDKKHVYDESKIKTLSSLEHIRLRTGIDRKSTRLNSSH